MDTSRFRFLFLNLFFSVLRIGFETCSANAQLLNIEMKSHKIDISWKFLHTKSWKLENLKTSPEVAVNHD